MKEKFSSALKFMRRNRTFTKLVSFILSVVILFYVIPSTIYTKAAELFENEKNADENISSVLNSSVYEIEELR